MSGRLATPVVSGKTGSHIEGQMPGGWEQRQRTPLTARYSIYCVYWYKKYIDGADAWRLGAATAHAPLS
jgi:hypothetical protein